MPKVAISDDQVDAYVAETYGEGITRNSAKWRAARKHLVEQSASAAQARSTPPATEASRLTITTEVVLDGVVINVSSQVVPLPKGITAS